MKLPINFDYLIAEIGGNHEGNVDWALNMISDAAKAGANAVKFQSYSAKELVNPKIDKVRFDHFDKFVLNPSEWKLLKNKAKDCNIDFLTSIWDIKNFKEILFEMPIIKVGSGDLTNYMYLREFALTNKPIIISTAMASLSEVIDAVSFIQKINSIYESNDMLCIMHCVAMYGEPKDEYANLNSISVLQSHFPNLNIGYSDHTIGFDAMLSAKSMGVNIFEFHFTFDKSRDFRDHHISLTKEELMKFKNKINKINTFNGQLVVAPIKEIETPQRIQEFRRACYFNRNMNKGELVSSEDIVLLRPNVGLSATKYFDLIGKKLVKDIEALSPISIDLFI